MAKTKLPEAERKARRRASRDKWAAKKLIESPMYFEMRKAKYNSDRVEKRAMSGPEIKTPEQKEARKAYLKEWRAKNPGKSTQYCYKWLEKNPGYYEAYNQENKKRIAEARSKRVKERKATDPGYRLLLALRRRLSTAIHRQRAGQKLNTKTLLGCSIDSFVLYIESKCESGWNWDNYGSVWEIDHIIPCAVFTLENPNHQRACFHFSNMQPMLKEKNNAKRAKLPDGFDLEALINTTPTAILT